MKEFVDNKYGQRKAQFFRDQVVSNAQAAMARMRADAVNNPEVFVDTPMAALGTSMYNGMSGQDILSMYDKKQNAYDSINPFNGLAQSFTDMTKYFNDPKYFAHKQEFYINDDYAKGLSEDDIANAFMRKGIGSDMAKTVAYDYFNPQQTYTTDMSNMSRDDIKAMRQKERDNYRKMKQNQKDWFDSATYVGGYAPSYACGGIKKMTPGGTFYKAQDKGYIFYFDPNTGNTYYDDGVVFNNGKEVGTYNINDYDFDFSTEPSEEQQSSYANFLRSRNYNIFNKPQTDTEVITGATDTIDTGTDDKDTSTSTGESTDSKTLSNGATPPAAQNDTYGRSFINISTPWGTGRVFVDNNNIDVRRNGRRLAIWGDRNIQSNINNKPTNMRMEVRRPQSIENPVYEPDFKFTPQEVKVVDQFNRPAPVAPIGSVSTIDAPVYEPTLSFPKIRRRDMIAPRNYYYGDKALFNDEISELDNTLKYSNPDRFKRCGGVTKAALGMALINDEKYDNGNMPNTPTGPVNPVSWEPMMTVDTTPSKEDTAIPETENIKMRNDQADAATGIKNKNDYGYGISNAAWNSLMFAGNFAEKMRNDKNKLASVAANLNNTQTPVMAMRGYDPTVNPTHLGYDADPSRLSVLGRYKCGGRKYAKGGIYDLTSNEIDEILKNGGKIEFIW